MPKFAYVATDHDGKKIKGVLESTTSVAAHTLVLERGLVPEKVKEKKGALQLELTKKKVPREEVMHFSRQLAAFIRAGIPILEAIDVIAQEAANAQLRRILLEVGDSLRRGDTFSTAVSAHAAVFPRFYVDMLRAAELTGRLDQVLDQLSSYIERDMEARRKIKSALAYPTIIGVMSIVTVVILTVFVLPRFRKFFESLNANLPLPTRILLGAAAFLGHWWWAIVGGALLVGLLTWAYIKTARGKSAKDKLVLKLPIAGEVARYAIVERFCRILGSMVSAGVPLPDAMIVVAEGTRNRVYERALTKVREEMLEGEGISRPIANTRLFPGAVTQMVRVGENTGTLDQQLETAAQFYEQELDYKLKKMTTLFEPMMIIFMGLVVGFVAVALVSAMYGIFRQAGTLG